MDSKELCNLQEAYMKVVENQQQLDELKAANVKVDPSLSREEVDFYDIILSHLLDEGYAENIESAEAIMVNMSEEWREDIMERENSPYEKASDAALDKRYGYGRASGDKRSFGRAANRSSAAAALRALRRGERSGSGTSTEAGADAVQLYTGMVYKGPGIVKEIKKELISILKKENLKNTSEAVGINA